MIFLLYFFRLCGFGISLMDVGHELDHSVWNTTKYILKHMFTAYKLIPYSNLVNSDACKFRYK